LFQKIEGGMTVDSLPLPHVLKSHLTYADIPKGPGRYIYVVRNGLDVAVSFHHQMQKNRFQGPFEATFRRIVAGAGAHPRWNDHVGSWFRNRDGLNVLYVSYHQLLTDFAATARRVADFIGVTVPESEWPRISERCSFEFMRKHESKFDDFVRVRGTSEDLHFIRRGIIGESRAFVTPETVRIYNAQFDTLPLRGLSLPPGLHADFQDPKGDGHEPQPQAYDQQRDAAQKLMPF
jgi:hypothetical protein